MSQRSEIIITSSICANCGKGEESNEDLKACSACHLVKYCNRECQLAHRTHHKKACKERSAELHEEALFRELLPPREKCPGCNLPMLFGNKVSVFAACCGNNVCIGCNGVLGTVEHRLQNKEGEKLCAVCKTPEEANNSKGDEVYMKRLKEHADMGNAQAIFMIGLEYSREGNMSKAHELWLKAGKLGCSEAYSVLANSMNPINDEYNEGGVNKRLGVKIDMKKAQYYYELAAIMGDVQARYFLGLLEGRATNNVDAEGYTFKALETKFRHRERAVKHFELAARAGHEAAMDRIKDIYNRQAMVKTFSAEEYENIVKAYTKSRDEMKSDDREKALAIRDMFWGRRDN
jgi:TPR repeat protein